MKTFLVMMFVAAVATATAIAQVDTAENVVNSTVRGTEQAARTVAHGVKKAADTVEDAVTPDSDARRVDVTVTDDRIDMPAQLKPGKTAFVVKNAGTTTQNFEVEGRSVDRKFAVAPKPGQTKVMHVILKRGTYTVYSSGKNGDQTTPKATLRVR
jgi:multidrug efflux pump subunit AcrA (membrane-fusion protein)